MRISINSNVLSFFKKDIKVTLEDDVLYYQCRNNPDRGGKEPAVIFFITHNQPAMSKKSSAKSEECTGEFCEMTPEEREQQIRITAYYLWKQKGEKHGEDRDDWFEAEASFHEDYSD